jgi:hypothetical protein
MQQVLDDQDHAELVGDDLLRGAEALGVFLVELGLIPPADDPDILKQRVYYAVKAKRLPVGKYGRELIASKTRLIKHVRKITAGA